jgi:uncharacterized phiE125 gp8 family phage protein
MYSRLITAASEDAVTLADAKLHCGIDGDDSNATILGFVRSAVDWAQTFTGRQFVTATWELVLPYFQSTIELPHPPVSAITSIKYYDTGRTQQTLSSTVYKSDLLSTYARISEAYGQVWPATCAEIDKYDVVVVRYVCGYGAESAVPDAIKTAIKMLAGHWFENREASTTGPLSPVPMAVESLLMPYRVNWNV